METDGETHRAGEENYAKNDSENHSDHNRSVELKRAYFSAQTLPSEQMRGNQTANQNTAQASNHPTVCLVYD